MDTSTGVFFLNAAGSPVIVPATQHPSGARLTAAAPEVGALNGDVVAVAVGHDGALLYDGMRSRRGYAGLIIADDAATANQAETVLRSVSQETTRSGNSVIARLSRAQIAPLAQRLATCDLALRVMSDEEMEVFRPLSLHQLFSAFRRESARTAPEALWALLDSRPEGSFDGTPFLHRHLVVPAEADAPDQGALEALVRLSSLIGAGGGEWSSEFDPASGITWSEVAISDGCSAAWAFTGTHSDSRSAMTAVVWASVVADQGPRSLFLACDALSPVPRQWAQAHQSLTTALSSALAGIAA